jgi:5-methylcytosine-specific restriction endonuclease McrA
MMGLLGWLLGSDRERMCGASRSSEWKKVRAEHLKTEPYCVICHEWKGVEVHHALPVHLYPERELDSENLITLCEHHHFEFGHLRDWRAYNATVREDCFSWMRRVKSRSYKRIVG